MAASSPLNHEPTSLTIAIDLEWYDQTNGAHLKEVGLAIHSSSQTINEHYIVEEHLNYINRYAKSGGPFQFGKSVTKPLQSVINKVKFWLSGAGYNCPVRLVVHNGKHDIRILQEHGISLRYVEMYDTGSMMNTRQPMSLKNALEMCGITPAYGSLHNAGNDAAYTLLLFQALRK